MSVITSLEIGQNKIEISKPLSNYIDYDLAITNSTENYFTITALHTGIIYVQSQLAEEGRITLINLSRNNLRSDTVEIYAGWVYTCQIQCRKGDEIKIDIMHPKLNPSHQIIRNYY